METKHQNSVQQNRELSQNKKMACTLLLGIAIAVSLYLISKFFVTSPMDLISIRMIMGGIRYSLSMDMGDAVIFFRIIAFILCGFITTASLFLHSVYVKKYARRLWIVLALIFAALACGMAFLIWEFPALFVVIAVCSGIAWLAARAESSQNILNDTVATSASKDSLPHDVPLASPAILKATKTDNKTEQSKDSSAVPLTELITPFHGPDGNVRGYMFEKIVYATREQAESAKKDKEARVFDGVLYATKAEADAARAAKEDLEARTVDGVVYETRELADKARAEKEEIEACTVDGVRYATRELAAQVRAEKEEIEACTVEGVRYATKEQADEARELASRTVDGVVYATKEEADQAARTVNGRVYMTREMAEKAKAELTDNRPEVGEIEVDQEFFKDKLEYFFDEYANKMVRQVPNSLYVSNKKEEVSKKVYEWLAGADTALLHEWKRQIEVMFTLKGMQQPLAKIMLDEVDKRLNDNVPAEQRLNAIASAPQAPGGEPAKSVSSDTANTPSAKNNKIWGIIAVAAIVGVVIMCLPKSGQRGSSSSYTSSAQRTVTRYAVINGTNVNVRNAPSLKDKNVAFQLSNETVRLVEKRNTGDKYSWYKVEKNGRTGWVYGRYVTEK